MLHSTQTALIQRTLSLINTQTTQMEDEPTLFPIDCFLSQEILEQEHEKIFKKYPIIIGNACDVQNPGEYFTHNESGIPILVIRDQQNILHAFVNVCRHRASILVQERSGIAKNSFKCPYHSWNYGLDGQLLHIPHAYGFHSDQCKNTTLHSLPITSKYGFIWVSLDPDATLDIESYLGQLAQELASYELEKSVTVEQTVKTINCNWKLWLNTAQEDYHFKNLHKNSIEQYFLDNVGLMDVFYPHLRGFIPRKDILECANKPEVQWLDYLHYANAVYIIFPNTMILTQYGRVTIVSMFPISADKSYYVHSVLLKSHPKNVKEKIFQEKNTQLFANASSEDISAAESMQAGIKSGYIKHLTLGRFEQGIAYYLKHIQNALQQ